MKEWKEGQTGVFYEALGHIDGITEITRNKRKNSINVGDLKIPSLKVSAFKGLNIDPQELYSFYDAINLFDSDSFPKLVKAIIEFLVQIVDAPDMMKRIVVLSTEFRGLVKKKHNLYQGTT